MRKHAYAPFHRAQGLDPSLLEAPLDGAGTAAGNGSAGLQQQQLNDIVNAASQARRSRVSHCLTDWLRRRIALPGGSAATLRPHSPSCAPTLAELRGPTLACAVAPPAYRAVAHIERALAPNDG
eukprot:6207990-Pleurochrysis_carterae.AAC.2